jgi:hypothetical protein
LVVPSDEVGCYRVYNRCVRGGFLLAASADSGQRDPRKDWIQSHLQCLCQGFAVEVCDSCRMDNHFHLLPALLAGPFGTHLCPRTSAAESPGDVDDEECDQVEDEPALEHAGSEVTGPRHSAPREVHAATAPHVRRDGSHT